LIQQTVVTHRAQGSEIKVVACCRHFENAFSYFETGRVVTTTTMMT